MDVSHRFLTKSTHKTLEMGKGSRGNTWEQRKTEDGYERSTNKEV